MDLLRRAHPQAESLLDFYGRVLVAQESVARGVRPAWVLSGQPSGPRIALRPTVDRSQARVFEQFVRAVAPGATDVIADTAQRLLATRSVAVSVLEAFVQRQSLDDLATSVGCGAVPLELFPHAFTQAVLEAAVASRRPEATDLRGEKAGPDASPAACPCCGWPPLATVLRDQAELKGARALVCSLCATEWPIPRSTCPHCGEVEPTQLEYHIAESWPHLRVEECRSCGVYAKAVDLRIDGAAQPLVDELASVELDLWADERGLDKLRRNLLGL